jgi:hypothetical protein
MKQATFWCKTILLVAINSGLCLAALPTRAAASGAQCQILLQKPMSKAEALQGFLEISEPTNRYSNPSESQKIDSALEKLVRFGSKEFQDLYDKALKGKSSLSAAAKKELLSSYAQSTWSRYKDAAQLEKLRSESLHKELDIRGAPAFPGLSGKQRLAKISRMNLERIWRDKGLRQEYLDDPEIQYLVKDIDLNVFRHSHNKDVYGEGVLSSQQLQYFNDSGINSQNSFNRDFLRSDDSIFFFLNFNRMQNQSSAYGQHGLSIKKDLLIKEGWVSPFIMWKQDFYKFAEEALPALSKKAGRKDKGTDEVFTPYDYSLREHLYEFDFTASDFKTLIQAQLAKVLTNKKDRRNFESGADLGSFMEEKVLKPLGLPAMLEFKIPVFLPKEDINQNW